jgi:hypothetical protein
VAARINDSCVSAVRSQYRVNLNVRIVHMSARAPPSQCHHARRR